MFSNWINNFVTSYLTKNQVCGSCKMIHKTVIRLTLVLKIIFKTWNRCELIHTLVSWLTNHSFCGKSTYLSYESIHMSRTSKLSFWCLSIDSYDSKLIYKDKNYLVNVFNTFKSVLMQYEHETKFMQNNIEQNSGMLKYYFL